MTDEPSIAEVDSEQSLARIFGSYADYVKSLPERKWTHGDGGWTSEPR
ncbi:hypothetical protein [Rhodanobacter glycinis]|nr:hypothetical protein [Rhodanobacter glycinis]